MSSGKRQRSKCGPLVVVPLLTFVLLATVLLTTAVTVRGEDTDDRFLDGLVRRQLFSLAETHCRDQLSALSKEDAAARRGAELAVDLSRIYAAHALHSKPETRAAQWDKAHHAIAEFVERHPHSAFLPVLRRQDALVHLSRGRLLRQESEVVADAAPRLAKARTELRAAIKPLTVLDRRLQEMLIVAERRGPSPRDTDALGTDELRVLRHDVRRQLAEALMNQGLSYAAQSADRVNSLSAARQRFTALAAIAPPIDWTSRLAVAQCERLLADYEAAAAGLDKILADAPPAPVRARAQLESARLALDGGRVTEALKILSADKVVRSVAAEWDFARLRALLAAWKNEKNTENADDRRQQAVAQIHRIESLHGPYWMRRAEALLGRHVATSPATRDLELLARAAASYYRSGKLDDALRAYDRAQQQATGRGDHQRAFKLAFTAATIEHDRRRHRPALSRYRTLALSNPRHNGAAGAHLLAVYHAAQLARAEKPPNLDPYVALLEEHLKHWPDEPTTGQAHWWLGRLREQQRDWTKAVAAYRAIRPEHERFSDAVDASAHCYRRWFDTLPADDKNRQRLANEAAGYFAGLIPGEGDADSERFDAAGRRAAVASARLRLVYAKRNYHKAEQTLARALAGSPDASAEWKAMTNTLLVWALAAQGGRTAEAEKALADVGAAASGDLMTLLEGLSNVAAVTAPAARRDVVRLQLQTARLLDSGKYPLDRGGQRKRARLEIEALVGTGARAEALAASRRLSEQYPRDGDIQAGYARLLLSAGDAATRKMALTKWREIETKSRVATPRWFEAKYAQALLHERLGDKRKAVRIVTLTRVLHPDLGGRQMKGRFLELLARCEEQ